MIKAVLFDRDGVLINSEIINIHASIGTLEKMGIQADNSDRAMIMGRHPLDYVDEFVVKYAIDRKDFLVKRMHAYKKMLAYVTVFDDAIDLLYTVRRMGILTALVTSASRETTIYTLSLFDLEKEFDTIVTFDDVTKRKPSPEPYKKAANILSVEPKNCLVIEDSLPGVEAAKSANMTCVVRRNEFTEEIEFQKADLIVTDVREVKTFITSLNKNEENRKR
jgi:HAD superfamily hydrolase (TIGR01509 family)